METFKINEKSKIFYKSKLYSANTIIQNKNNILYNLENSFENLDNPVVIFLERDINLIFSMLAIINLGTPYILIDTDAPIEKIYFILKECNVINILTSLKYKNIFKDNLNVLFIDKLNNAALPLYKNSKADLAYIMYTSGSTGEPKGVKIKKKALNNFTIETIKLFNFNESTRILSLTKQSFDIFFLESIVPLFAGGTVLLLSDFERANPRVIMNLIKAHEINTLQITPTLLSTLINSHNHLENFKYLKNILIGGEDIPMNILKKLKKYTKAEIFNLYGPTEATIWTSISNITHKDEIDLGIPLNNTNMFLVNSNHKIIENDEIGEIAISGVNIADGYTNIELNKINFKFFKNDTIYLTGDLGKMLPNGLIKYIGRKDRQIKFNGYRIELEEIERTLEKINYIKKAVALLDENNNKIIAYYLSEIEIPEEQIKTLLKKFLPQYMIPQNIIKLNNFIVNKNGKFDINNLKQFYSNSDAEINSIEKEIIDIIKNIISETNISRNDRIDHVGIDSLAFIKLIYTLETKFNIIFDDNMLLIKNFYYIKDLINYVQRKTTEYKK